MYLSHFGLNEPPFRITPHTEFFYDGAKRGATLEALSYAITHDEGIVKVTGEVGAGKTMLCRVLMERLPASVVTVYLANPSLSREEILYAIADELRLALTSDRALRLLRELQDHLIAMYGGGKRVVVLIDEAHAMPKETLEEIRLLSNLESGHHKLLQIVLFGQPELNDLLSGADMRQLKERITHSFTLEPFVKGDIENYIDFRMRAAGYRGPNVFTARAVRLIASASGGLTRRVNILADKSLLAAFAGGTHAVTDKEARAAIRDSDFYRPHAAYRKFWFIGAALVLGLVAGVVAGPLLMGDVKPSAAETGRSGAISPALAPPSAALAATTTTAAATSVAAEPVRSLAAAPVAAPPAPPREPATAGAIASAAAVLPAAPTTAVVSKPAAATDTATPPMSGEPLTPRGKLSAQVFAATQAWLKSAPAAGYSIQLLTVKGSEIGTMERFLARAGNEVPVADLHLYSVKIDGIQNYRAAFGYFADIGEINTAIKTLPVSLAAQKPYSRSLERMRSQNRQ